MSFYLISISRTADGTESYGRILENQNLFIQETLSLSYLLNINSSLKVSKELRHHLLKNVNVISEIV